VNAHRRDLWLERLAGDVEARGDTPALGQRHLREAVAEVEAEVVLAVEGGEPPDLPVGRRQGVRRRVEHFVAAAVVKHDALVLGDESRSYGECASGRLGPAVAQHGIVLGLQDRTVLVRREARLRLRRRLHALSHLERYFARPSDARFDNLMILDFTEQWQHLQALRQTDVRGATAFSDVAAPPAKQWLWGVRRGLHAARMYTLNHTAGEQYYVRLLLLNVAARSCARWAAWSTARLPRRRANAA
jgi:hypothetical protein